MVERLLDFSFWLIVGRRLSVGYLCIGILVITISGEF